uniref:Uncharacterized protein n=1 Tax=Steinernema glaseri TaxID=37863 RepID=A0A1I7Y9L3_9BILA
MHYTTRERIIPYCLVQAVKVQAQMCVPASRRRYLGLAATRVQRAALGVPLATGSGRVRRDRRASVRSADCNVAVT